MSAKKVAVVILNYNGASFLQQFLPSLIAHTPHARLLVADNASTDNSLEVVHTFPTIEWVSLGHNYGFAEGYNKALQHVNEPYSLLLNSDVAVSAGWLQPMLSFLESHADYAACQPKVLSWHQPDYFEYAGAAGGYIDWLGYPFCRGRIFDTLEKDRGQYDKPARVAWTTGACMLIKTQVFLENGGFDPRFFAHMEEVDLCWRLERSGYKLAAIPESVVYHVGGGTLPKTNPKKYFLNFRNGLVMLFRNTSPRMRWVKIPLRILLDWGAFLQFLLKGELQVSTQIPKAHWAALRLIMRTEAGTPIQFPPLVTHSTTVILWDYFLHSKSKFSSLRFQKDIEKVQI